MSAKRLIALAAMLTVAAALVSGSAFAQKPPAAGTNWTVSKTTVPTPDMPDVGQFKTIQEAVNAADVGHIIEILDDSVYVEQVTIDGRPDLPVEDGGHPWGNTIKGNKNGITIRYVPSGPNDTKRPTIRYTDRENRSPLTCYEAAVPGDGPGTSGNFETAGAVRIIRAQGVKLEGLIIDGGEQLPFGEVNIWHNVIDPPCGGGGGCDGSPCPLVHGNAAVAVAVSGNIQIRDCELRNAHIGIAVKDRNSGGVFGNPNPSDNDWVVPLSRFGQTGNHLFEYNKIHGNNAGIFFESAWDLGSTVRFNYIYNNYRNTTVTNLPGSNTDSLPGSNTDRLPGGIVFKDNFLTPIAIYNNTFHNNAGNIVGQWKIGYQHLIFNNIFGPTNKQSDYLPDMHDILSKFPYRLFHNILASSNSPTSQGGANCLYANTVQFGNGFAQLPQTSTGLACAANQSGAVPGAIIQQANGTGASNTNVNISGNFNRWLEMAGTSGTGGFPLLYKSINSTSPDFLVPDWDNPLVDEYVKNSGWVTGGILDQNGLIASIGAAQYNGRRPFVDAHMGYSTATSRARISPFSVISVNGTTARASIIISDELGTLENISVKYVRWIAPIPRNDSIPSKSGGAAWGNDGLIIPGPLPSEANRAPNGSSIMLPTISSTASFVQGSGRVEFTLPRALQNNDRYGFFEIVLEGTDQKGKKVVSDIGFLPYRQLDYVLQIEILNDAMQVIDPPVVIAGEPVKLRVTAMKKGPPDTPFEGVNNSTNPIDIEYQLLSDPSAMMFELPSNRPFTNKQLTVNNAGRYVGIYDVYFTRADPGEIVLGSGLWCDRNCDNSQALRISFLGDLVVHVRPGAPEKVVFVDPVSKSMLPEGVLPPGLSGEMEVTVKVTDKFNNATDQEVPVTIRSEDAEIGQVGRTIAEPVVPTSNTNASNGIATFWAWVTNGAHGNIFDITASIPQINTNTDVASLRIARPSDNLRVLYANSGNDSPTWRADDDVRGVDTIAGRLVPVWIKAVKGGGATVDEVMLTKNGFIKVTPTDPDLAISLTSEGGGTPGATVTVAMVNGVAQIWVTSTVGIEDVGVEVVPYLDAEAERRDNSLGTGSRNGLTFRKLESGINSAVIYSDNGFGIPDRVVITFDKPAGADDTDISASFHGDWALPSRVEMKWPCLSSGDWVSATNIAVIGGAPNAYSVVATFAPDAFVSDYTTIANNGSKLIKVLGGGGKDDVPSEFITNVTEAIGPLILKRNDSPACGLPVRSNPKLTENLGTGPDVLRIQVSEQLHLGASALIGADKVEICKTDELPGCGVFATVIRTDEVGEWYVLEIDQSGARPGRNDEGVAVPANDASGYWYVRLAPGADIKDASGSGYSSVDGGTGVHADNRFVRIDLVEIPPKVTASWYTINNLTGLLSQAFLVFDKNLPSDEQGGLNDWFQNGSLTFTWNHLSNREYGIGAVPGASLLLRRGADGAGDTVVINLVEAFASSQALEDPITGGNMNIKIGYGGTKGEDWPIYEVFAADAAAPVLVAATLKIGAIEENRILPDTLVLKFSERLHTTIMNVTAPVGIANKNHLSGGYRWVNVTCGEPTGENEVICIVSGTLEVYDPESATGKFPTAGDLVMINYTLAELNAEGNVSVRDNSVRMNFHTDINRAVPLRIQRGPTNWEIIVRNNPFRGGNGQAATVVLTPNSKGGWIDITANIAVYNNMGNLVKDTVITHIAKGEDDKIEWKWDGRNSQGRFVGTGSYLAKFTCIYDIRSSADRGEKPENEDRRYEASRMIGFVRGKN